MGEWRSDLPALEPQPCERTWITRERPRQHASDRQPDPPATGSGDSGSPAGADRPGDRIDVSPHVAAFHAAMRAAERDPVVRERVMVELRQLIEAGSLDPDSARLAVQMLDHLETHLVRPVEHTREGLEIP